MGGGLRRRPVMQPLPVAVDLHADVLGVPHDRSLDEALHVEVVEGLGAGARGTVLALGSVGATHSPAASTGFAHTCDVTCSVSDE